MNNYYQLRIIYNKIILYFIVSLNKVLPFVVTILLLKPRNPSHRSKIRFYYIKRKTIVKQKNLLNPNFVTDPILLDVCVTVLISLFHFVINILERTVVLQLFRTKPILKKTTFSELAMNFS